jgi:hypothetical protein
MSDNNLEVGAPMPHSIGRCADMYHEVRELRLAMQKETEAVEAREKEIKAYIIDNLSKSDDTGAAGLRYRAQIVMKVTAKIADWGVFTSWVRKHDRFDCLQKRVTETAIKDLWAEREAVPGIEKVNIPDVSITKI